MAYTNKCPVTLELLTKENAFLVKVPLSKDNNKYYYISDKETLEKLTACPFTRRQADYYVLPLSELLGNHKTADSQDVASKLLKDDDANTLIEDNAALAAIDKANKFNWQLKNFKNKTNNRAATSQRAPLAFTNIQIPATRILPPNHQFISDYKAGFFRHPLPLRSVWDIFNDLSGNDFRRYRRIVNELMNDAQLEEHDLIFLMRAHKLISELDDGRYKIALNNAVYAQITRYVAGFFVLTNTMSIILDFVNNGFSSSMFSGALSILLLDRVQDTLVHILRQNKQFDVISAFNTILVDIPKQLTRRSGIENSIKSAASNAYEFVRTNLSFLHNKFVKSEPVQYELPDDLARASRQFN
ncbi:MULTISPECIES: hypothetical protein [Legionella]|uniref:hypothetical protein n=1 Tax=Legionella TaxID=445 RepID=UPI00096857B3|nr:MULTISPECIES: hypothetical protein [Legionella]MBN9227311.1 hypothetical protein [Legionella steelei]OJW13988.1 MAG: hypothetical protein BGO44_08500 [Legionella sp. 39-23]